MTANDALVEVLVEATGTRPDARYLAELRRQLPVDLTAEQVLSAEIPPHGSTVEIVGAIRGACRAIAAGAAPTPRRRVATAAPPVAPLPTPPPPEVGARGLAAARAALEALSYADPVTTREAR